MKIQEIKIGDKVRSILPYDDFKGEVIQIKNQYRMKTIIVQNCDKIRSFYNPESLEII